MRNAILSMFLMLALVTFIRCTSDSNESVASGVLSNSSVNQRLQVQRLYDSIINLKSLEVQKILVSSYDMATQVELWNLKIDNFKSKDSLSSEQKNLVDAFKNDITVSNFSKVQVDKNPTFISSMRHWETDFINVFGFERAYYFLHTFENRNQTLAKIYGGSVIDNGDPDNSLKACNCNVDRNCFRPTGWISWEYGRCESNNCYVRTYFFGLIDSTDNKKCVY